MAAYDSAEASAACLAGKSTQWLGGGTNLARGSEYLVICAANATPHSLLDVAQHGVGLATASLAICKDA